MKPFVQVLSDKELWDIHCASLDTLENVGVDVYDVQARETLLGIGSIAGDSNRVRIPARLVKAALEKCAPVILLHGREGLPRLRIGGSRVYYGTTGFPITVLDWRTGELRDPRLSDLEEAARLTDMLDNIDVIVPPLSPRDVPEEYVDRYQWLACLLNTRKPIVSQCYDAAGLHDLVAMASELAGGLDNLRREPFVLPFACITSPLTLRRDACEVIMGSAELSLPLSVSAGPMAGGTAPATLAGSLTLANAEVLAGLVLAKAVNESQPFIYASCARTLDMKYGNVALGAPEVGILQVAATQLAKMYGLPCLGCGLLTDSNLPDAQAGYEKLGTALLPALAGLNIVLGAAAYGAEMVLTLEGYVIDDEVVGWVKRVLAGFAVDDEHLALDLIAAQGPGGLFITEDHTLRHFRQEMWIPTLSDRIGTIRWREQGEFGIRARAREVINDKLNQYQALSLPDDMAERLQAIIDCNVAESQDVK